MMPDDKNAHAVFYNSIEKMIRKAFEVDPPEVGFEEVVSAGPLGGVQHQAAQFVLKILSQFLAVSSLEVVHDLIHIGTNAPMQDEVHALRCRCMCRSMSCKVIASAGLVSNSASRRNASVTPSSSSRATGGRDRSRREAKPARSFSGKRNASAAICSTLIRM